MALAARLRSEKQSRWEIQLGQALSDFQETLTSEQRASFLANRMHSSATPPTIRDVMNITAEVDRLARRDKRGSQQCFGPRLTRFLEVVQQYASIGDVLVGGSQNLIACGVWSLVRVTLLTVCKFSPYLERVSRLFMNIGQSVPQIQDIASLYPDSKVLQGLVAEYFLGVVKLCQRLMSLHKQSMAEQLKSFFCDWDAIGQDSDLAKLSGAIYERLQIEHAQSSSSSLSRLNSLSAQKRTRQAQKDHHRLLEACSTYNYMTAWKRTKKIGYSAWDFCKTEYDAWTSNISSSTLILKGKLGGGKSVLLANMVNDLNLKQVGFKIIYFFCKEDDAISLDTRTIVGCLCRQLLQLLQPSETAGWAGAFTHPDSDDLLELLKKVLPAKEKVFVILDGIESCELKEENELLAWIRSLQDHLTLALCISCRIDARSTIGRNVGTMQDSVWVTLPDVRPEISDYVKDRLTRKIQSGELRFRDPKIQSSIEEGLISGCQGMFLWVHLQLESICQEQTDEAILNALSSLPRTLPDLFHDILSRHHERSPRFQKPVLKLLSTALRPLLLAELEEALSVVPGVTKPQPGDLVNNIRAVLASCGSLVVIDEEQLTVHFVHHSVNQYLIDIPALLQMNKRTTFCFVQEEAQREMGDIVVTYLSWDRLNFAVASTQEAIEQPIGMIPGRVLESTVFASLPAPVRTRALELSSRYRPQKQTSGTPAASLKIYTESSAAHVLCFKRYAEDYWLHHTKSTHGSSSQVWSLFNRLASKRWLVTGALLWKDRPPIQPDDETSWADYHAHTSMLIRIFEARNEMHLLQILLQNKAPSIIQPIEGAIEVLCRAQVELEGLMVSSSGMMEESVLAESQGHYASLGDICDMHKQQLGLIKSTPTVTEWDETFKRFVEIFELYQPLGKLESEHYVSAFNSTFEQLHDFEPALQAYYETAELRFLKRRITLAMYALQRAIDCRAETGIEIFVNDAVKALILRVDDWMGFPITKVGLLKGRAPCSMCHSSQGVDTRNSSLMMRGYIYSFPDHLLLVERASDSTISDLESNEPWIPFWYCGLDQVSSWLDRSAIRFGTFELNTVNGSSVTFSVNVEDPWQWLAMAVPGLALSSV